MEQDWVQIIYSLTIFIIGSLFGSFFTLAIYRIPRAQDIWITRSYCPRCKHNLGFFDCFPIFSYISKIGRCKYCNCYIAYRYIIIELISGLVFLLSYLLLGFSIKFFIIIACYVYLFLSIGSDIMASKMTEEEKKIVADIKNKRKEEKKNKKEKKTEEKEQKLKKGLINIEIVVATIIFTIYFTSTVYISRNYRLSLEEYKRKSDALTLCMNKVESLKSKNIAEIVNEKNTFVLEGTNYYIDTTASVYLKEGYIENSNAKIVDVKVTYTFLNKERNSSISFILEETAI